MQQDIGTFVQVAMLPFQFLIFQVSETNFVPLLSTYYLTYYIMFTMKPKKTIVSLMAPTKYTRAEEGNQLTRRKQSPLLPTGGCLPGRKVLVGS